MITFEQMHVLSLLERQGDLVAIEVPFLDRDTATRTLDLLVQQGLADVRRDTYGPVYYINPQCKAY